ncbi:MAG TPA: hypothetical protein VFT49_04475 [Candidatus Saccharimonadales bacterium]|nr:hypothetical protein [Candidatus Saccharimonadales bacterium]
MPGLQTAYYIIGIVFMGIILILIAALVIAVFVIRAKVNNIERRIEERINEVSDLTGRGGEILAAVGKTVAKKTAQKIKKSVAK